MHPTLQKINNLSRLNKLWNNFFWYQFQPADEREASIFSKVYERSFFTLFFTLMFSAIIFYIFPELPTSDPFTAFEKFLQFPIFLLYAPVIMLLTFYQGYRIFSREQISYKKRKPGLVTAAGSWTIMIIAFIIAYRLLFSIHP